MKYNKLKELEERKINRTIYKYNKKIRSLSFECRENHKKYMCKKLLIALITILIVFDNKKVYGQIQINNIQDGQINEAINQDVDLTSNIFIINNNVYKNLKQGEVILWSSNNDDVIIKNNVNYNGNTFKVKYIYEKAFEDKDVKNLVIEENILGFCDSDGKPIIKLGGVFKNKRNLTNVDLGEIDCSLYGRCFFNCNGLKKFKMSKNISSIGNHTFDGCASLKEVNLNGIKKIEEESSFAFCKKLSDIGKFNNELIELPARTFMNCNNLHIDSLDNIYKIGDSCFEGCTALNKDILDNVQEIGKRSFWACGFNKLYLKEAKKIGENALGGMASLKTVRFGNREIPFLEQNISMGSSISEWIYPKDYINQAEYQRFLSKLRLVNVKWYPNYDNSESIVTQDVNLSIKTNRNMNKDMYKSKVPDVARLGYEIEGWYKEPECINKVNIIADLGEVVDSDIVINNSKLYEKWIKKEDKNKNDEKTTGDKGEAEKSNDKENSKPNDAPKPTTEKEEEKGSKDEKTTGENGEPEKSNDKENSKSNDAPKPTTEKEEEKGQNDEKTTGENGQPEKSNDKENSKSNGLPKPSAEKNEDKAKKYENNIDKKSESDKIKVQESKKNYENEEAKEKKRHRLKKRRILNQNKELSQKAIDENNLEKQIGAFTIISNNHNKDIELNKCNASSLDYKMTEEFLLRLLKNYNNIEVTAISYNDIVNYNMEVSKGGILGQITNNGLHGVYLKSFDYLKKDSFIEIKFKGNLNLNKLYLYNSDMRKFLLMNDNLEVIDKVVRIKPMDKKEYIITNFELNKEEVIHEGWNKINNEWYYIDKEGSLVINSIIDGYKVGSDGKLI